MGLGIGLGMDRLINFSPVNLAGCILWLDATDITTLTFNGAGQRVTDGDMEAAGTGAWSVYNAATLSKESGAPGGSGSQVIRVTRVGDTGSAYQSTPVVGREYRWRGWGRSDGTAAPSVGDGSSLSNVWLGSASTTWQYFDVIHTPVWGFAHFVKNGAAGTWVEFDDVVVEETNPRISAWDDRSGNGNNASQAVAGNQPDYTVTGGVNGLPGVDFVAANSEFLNILGMVDASDDWTLIAAINQGASTAQPQSLLGYTAAATSFLSGIIAPDVIGGFDETAWRSTGTGFAAGDQYLEYHWDSATPQLSCFRNGSSIGNAAYDATGQIVNNVRISRHPTVATYYCNMVLSELILYNRILTAAELSLIRKHMTNKYGL
jgi:hypothetical protein